MDLFPLAIFPENGLHHSLVPAVFIGLLWTTFFNESFGWIYSGIVVPGYLASLFLVDPVVGCLVVAEALATYGLCRLLSDGASLIGLWTPFFGRERFFLLLTMGMLVRALVESVILPALVPGLESALGRSIETTSHLFTVGLVVIPLAANMIWNVGLSRGLVQAGSIVVATYLTVRFLLVPATNFSLGALDTSFEAVAHDFEGSVKAHILLLSTAFLASFSNREYGWDYGGILVPALLSLAWFTPAKIVGTAVEAVLAYFVATQAVRLPLLRGRTIEGGRKLLLVFAVDLVLRIAAGHALLLAPEIRATDVYGFGYLLPSLLAVKIWQKGKLAHVFYPTLATSLAGAVGGSAVALLLGVLLGTGSLLGSEGGFSPEPPVTRKGSVRLEARLARAFSPPAGSSSPAKRPGHELELVATGARELARYLAAPESDQKALENAGGYLRKAGFELSWIEEPGDSRILFLSEARSGRRSSRGWGCALFDPTSRSPLVLEATRPFAEPLALETGLALFRTLEARALLVAGADDTTSPDGVGDVVGSPRTPFLRLQWPLSRSPILEVRIGPEDLDSPELRFLRTLPPQHVMGELRDLFPSLRVDLRGDLFRNHVLAASADGSYATLLLDPGSARRFLLGTIPSGVLARAETTRSPAWILAARVEAPASPPIATSGLDEELLLLERDLFAPLFQLARRSRTSELDASEIEVLALAAADLGIGMTLHTRPGGRGALLEASGRGSTTLVRLGPSTDLAIEVDLGSDLSPTERDASLVLGERLFEESGAIALSTSPLDPAREALLAGLPEGRVLALLPPTSSLPSPLRESVLSTGVEVPEPDQIAERWKDLFPLLEAEVGRLRIHDGRREAARLSGDELDWTQATRLLHPDRTAFLWMSEECMARLEGAAQARAARIALASEVGVSVFAGRLGEAIPARLALISPGPPAAEATNLLEEWTRTGDLSTLRIALGALRTRGAGPTLVLDPRVRDAFVVVRSGEREVTIYRENPLSEESLTGSAGDPEILERFLRGGCARLALEVPG